MTSYENLRIQRNRVHIAYEKEVDISKKMDLLRAYKELCLAADAAYRQEIKGETI